MKKYIRIFALAAMATISSLGAKADQKSDELLKALADKMQSHHAYQVEFTVDAKEQMPKTSGSFIVSGDYYYINVSGIEVFYNGKTRETYNRYDNELIVENYIPKDESLMVNPTKIFKLYGSEFTHVMGQSDDPKLEAVEMTPTNPQYNPMIVYINKQTGLATKSTVEIDDSTNIEFIIDEILFDVGVDSSTFNFDRKKHKNVEVITY